MAPWTGKGTIRLVFDRSAKVIFLKPYWAVFRERGSLLMSWPKPLKQKDNIGFIAERLLELSIIYEDDGNVAVAEKTEETTNYKDL